jgi:hypothetical protein
MLGERQNLTKAFWKQAFIRRMNEADRSEFPPQAPGKKLRERRNFFFFCRFSLRLATTYAPEPRGRHNHQRREL